MGCSFSKPSITPVPVKKNGCKKFFATVKGVVYCGNNTRDDSDTVSVEKNGDEKTSEHIENAVEHIKNTSINIPELMQDFLGIAHVASHITTAVLTGNISAVVKDIVAYAKNAKDCREACIKLSEDIERARDAIEPLLDLKDQPGISKKNYNSALQLFAGVLDKSLKITNELSQAHIVKKILRGGRYLKKIFDLQDQLKDCRSQLSLAVAINQIPKIDKIHEVIVNGEKAAVNDDVTDPFHGVPSSAKLIGRQNHLKRIEEEISKNNDEKAFCPIVLNGLNGIGKTHIMLRYCYLHKTDYDYTFWVQANGEDITMDSFRKLAKNLGLDENTTKNDSNSMIESVKIWLEKKSKKKKWLLLLDNAEHEIADQVFEYLPRYGGDIIITTSKPIASNKASLIKVAAMTENEAFELFISLLGDRKNMKPHIARKIVIELYNIPVTISLAGAYIKETGCTLEYYLNMIKKSRNTEDNPEQNQCLVESVLQLSFKRIQDKNPIAAKILESSAFLQSDSIPAELFEQQHAALELKSSKCSQSEIHDAIATLTKFSLMTENKPDENLSNRTLMIHQLTQKGIYDTMTDKAKLNRVKSLSSALNNVVDPSHPDNIKPNLPEIMDTYLSHIRSFVTRLSGLETTSIMCEDLLALLHTTTCYLVDNGVYSGTDKLAHIHLSILEEKYGVDDLRTLKAMISLAGIYLRQGKDNEAEVLCEYTKKYEEALGDESLEMAQSLSNMALFYDRQGMYDKAEPLYKSSLEIHQKLGDKNLIARSQQNLSILYYKEKKYAKAELHCKNSLEIRQNTLGPEDPETLQSLSNLVTIYERQRNYTEAGPLCIRGLEIFEKIYGAEHPNTIEIRKHIVRMNYQ